MQKTLPSQKNLRSGFRIGSILHGGSVYCAYEKHWYFPHNAGENHSGMLFVLLGVLGARSASGALHHVKSTLLQN